MSDQEQTPKQMAEAYVKQKYFGGILTANNLGFFQNLVSPIEQFIIDCDNTDAVIESLKSQLSQTQAENTQLKENISFLVEENTRLKSEVASLREALKGVQALNAPYDPGEDWWEESDNVECQIAKACKEALSSTTDYREEFAGKVADSWLFEREPLFDDDPNLGCWAAVSTLYAAIGAILGISEDEAAEWFKKRAESLTKPEGGKE